MSTWISSSSTTLAGGARDGGGPEWELSKENAAPLERGRNANTLGKALSANKSSSDDGPAKERNEAMVRRFEKLVRPSEKFAELIADRTANSDGDVVDIPRLIVKFEAKYGEDQLDPLVHWLSYIKFHQETFPSDTRSQFLLMERCTRSLLIIPRYVDDVRFIRVCVLYADKTSFPGDIFKFLHKKGVGSRTALFWVAWAWVAEKSGDFPFAEKVLQKGLSKGAKPVKMLEERHRQFQRRMSRHWLNSSASAMNDAVDEDEGLDQENRGSRGVLSSLSRDNLHPNERSGGASNHQQQRQERGSNLSTFSVRQHSRSENTGGRSRENGIRPTAASGGGFRIFADGDNACNDDGGYDLDKSQEYGHSRGGRRGQGSLLTREMDRKKENVPRTERWNERGGLGAEDSYRRQPSHHRSTSAGGGAGSSSTFEVFVDEDCAAKHEQEEEDRELRATGRRRDDGRSLRQRVDGDMADKLTRDPLRYVRNPLKLKSDKAKNDDRNGDAACSSSYPTKTGGGKDGYGHGTSLDSRGDEKRAMNKARRADASSNGGGSGKPTCGFSKYLISKDPRTGQECCFEEGRADATYYKLCGPDGNFNLLEVETEVTDEEDSVMDVEDDEGSIEDVTMEEDEEDRAVDCEKKVPQTLQPALRIPGSQLSQVAVGHDSAAKASMPRKVLFGFNTSTGSQNNSYNNQSIVQNTSQASSTVNERDAVGGIPGGKEEETINTKFAMRELSMMFSSPAVDGGDGPTADASFAGPTTGGRHHQRSDSADQSSASTSSAKPLFSLHRRKQSSGSLGGIAAAASGASSTPVGEQIHEQQRTSPTVHSPQTTEEYQVTENGDTATFSVMAGLIDDCVPSNTNYNDNSILAAAGQDMAAAQPGKIKIFVDENDENQAPSNPAARMNSSAGFDRCALRTMGRREVESEDLRANHVLLRERRAALGASNGNAGIGATAGDAAQHDGANFEIYRDEEEDEVTGEVDGEEDMGHRNRSINHVPARGALGQIGPSTGGFTIFQDGDDEDADNDERADGNNSGVCDDEGNDIASFSVFGNAMKALEDVAGTAAPSVASKKGANGKKGRFVIFSDEAKGEKKEENGSVQGDRTSLRRPPNGRTSRNKRRVTMGGHGFSIFCDNDAKSEKGKNQDMTDDFTKCEPPSDDTLTENVGFGDISRIAPENDVDDTSSHHIAQQSPRSPTLSVSDVLRPENAIDYEMTHKKDVDMALLETMEEAARSLAFDESLSNETLEWCGKSRGMSHVCDRRSKRLPRPVRQKEPARGANIDLGGLKAVVKHELGRGAYGVVLLCDATVGPSLSSVDDASQETIALKVQAPTGCLAWEYSMLKKIEKRLPNDGKSSLSGNISTISSSLRRSSRKRQNSEKSDVSSNGESDQIAVSLPFPRAVSFVAFSDGALLGMTAGSNSGMSLVDVVNGHKVKGGGPVPELIAMHYTTRMLLHLESLHWHAKVLHCDVKPDNWVLMASNSACGEVSDKASTIEGSDLMLVDFGRAIDLASVGKDQTDDVLDIRLHGNVSAEDMACVAMREGHSWGLDIDTYGLCASAHVLLYGTHIHIERDSTSKRWRPQKPLRRYWNKPLWHQLFDTLLNVDGTGKTASMGSHPNSLRAIRKSFESYLNEGSRWNQVESLLRHQAGLLPKRR